MRPIFKYISILCLLPLVAQAQTLSFKSDDPDKPIEVVAERGIEWRQDEKRFIARGDARATQGDVEVVADELIAHYRETDNGGTDVYRVDAIGSVTITSAGETATGSAAVYDFEQAVLVMEGSPVRLETSDGVVTAYDTIQYWEQENVAVAEGNAMAVQGGQKLTADTLTARFKEPASGTGAVAPRSSELSRIEGYGNVRLESKGDIILGDRGRYDLASGIATLDGNVRITSDRNQLSGGFAVVDTKKGTSTLFANATEAGVPGPGPRPRVRALLVPRPKGVTD
ncbi:MAG: LptA/OstA family protein [Rhodospirillaceae bacterium]